MTATTATNPGDDIIPLPWRVPEDSDEDTALDKHLQMMRASKEDLSEATIQSHKYRLGRFIDWLTVHPARDEPKEGPGIEMTTELTKRHLKDYKMKRSNEVKTTTVKTEMDTIRVFIRNLEGYDAIPEGLHDYAESPSLEGGEGQRSDHLPTDRGNAIRDHLREWEWATEGHVLFELLWSTGMRLGSAHGLNVDDIDFEKGQIKIRHRPKKGTTLKNKKAGERNVILRDTVADAIKDYLNHPERPDEVEDEHGQEPLFCNEDGTDRRHKLYLRELIYAVTRPCKTDGDCPEDHDPDDCPGAQSKKKAFKCPFSKAPHAIRSGALTRMMENEIPPWAISKQVNCSEDVLEEHYIEMDEDEKTDAIRDHFEDDYD